MEDKPGTSAEVNEPESQPGYANKNKKHAVEQSAVCLSVTATQAKILNCHSINFKKTKN